jgi:DNA-binding transcriptional LysR family regulator
VHRAGGAAAAADKIGVSHATVSRRISDVEKSLGVTLVDRSGLGWKVTPLCSTLAEQAIEMEAHHAEALRLANAFSSNLSGQVKISVPTGSVASFCGEALKSLPKEAPEIGIVFLTEDKLADLPGRRADLAVRFTDTPQEDLIGVRVAISHWGLFARADIAARIKGERIKGELPRVPLITTSEDRKFPTWGHGVFDPESTCHYVFGFVDKAELAMQGFGVVMLPTVVGRKNASLVHLEELPSDLTNDLWVLANTDTRASKRISLVKKHLIRGFENMSNLF